MKRFSDIRKVDVGIGRLDCDLVYLNEDGDQVGSMLLVYESDCAKVFSLEVLSAHRGKGYGRRLMEAAIAHARSKGLTLIELNTEKDNVAANRLYESLGFGLAGEKFGFNNYVLPLSQ